ncbi:hypothetical protein Prum_008740 [Phytohabitans rumicis]|uniref:Uncharacterized protein n=1 Tax=Phytohabitans rumicis TaxID=1076125 RepID=A0A6V8KPY7_9ACTN|nr:hypothetical protein Prum_008740 [Phytohabitans rumicis]
MFLTITVAVGLGMAWAPGGSAHSGRSLETFWVWGQAASGVCPGRYAPARATCGPHAPAGTAQVGGSQALAETPDQHCQPRGTRPKDNDRAPPGRRWYAPPSSLRFRSRD